MLLSIIQGVAAVLALLVSIQGLTEVSQGLALGALKAACCPLIWLYLARKLKSLYASSFLIMGGLFMAVVLVPTGILPAVAGTDDTLLSVLGLGTFLGLNLWAAYHARWAQLKFFKKDSAL